MYSDVIGQVLLPGEGLRTEVTSVGRLSRMLPHVVI